MHYVYLLQSIKDPSKRYVGLTHNIESRIKAHNAGESKYTSKFCPWDLVVYHAFKNKKKAQEFEYYLKSGSGKAFANKRFWDHLVS